MRLTCPECSAAYDAPDHLFGPQPRQVRCNRCGFQWTVIGPAKTTIGEELPLAPAPLPPAAVPPEPAPLPPAPPAPIPVVAEPVAPSPVTPPPVIPPPAPILTVPESQAVEVPPDPVVAVLPATVAAAPKPSGSSRLADTLAGTPPAASLRDEEVLNDDEPRNAGPASTRKLFGGATALDASEMGPDPEERRLSAELDFGKPDRYERERGGGAKWVVLTLIAAIIILCVAAVIFKDNIVANLPAAESLYAAVGLR